MPSVWAAFGNITRVPPGTEHSLDLEIDIRYRYKGFLHKMPLRGNCIQFAIRTTFRRPMPQIQAEQTFKITLK